MHEAVILLSLSVWFWQLINKNMQLLSLLICCEAYINTQTIVKCAAYETLIDPFQSLSFFWRTLKNNVQFALMFVCCKVQFEKK